MQRDVSFKEPANVNNKSMQINSVKALKKYIVQAELKRPIAKKFRLSLRSSQRLIDVDHDNDKTREDGPTSNDLSALSKTWSNAYDSTLIEQ